MSTVAQIQARLDAYLAAELRVLQSQEYQVGQGGNSRRSVRAELETVRQTIKQLEDELDKARSNTAGRRVYSLVPR